MTPQQINKAIAEACGWVEVHSTIGNRSTLYGWHPKKHPKEKHYYETLIPRYTTDLNAMNEAEGTLTNEQLEVYCNILHKPNHGGYWAIHATAAQRAEAFLRTLGKWEDGE